MERLRDACLLEWFERRVELVRKRLPLKDKRRSGLSVLAAVILEEIAFEAGFYPGNCGGQFVNVKAMAASLGLRTKTLRRYLKIMNELGLIELIVASDPVGGRQLPYEVVFTPIHLKRIEELPVSG